jgi:putative oxidoreductase
MYELIAPWMHLVGRILFALVFILSGINHLTQLGNMAGYAQSKGLPAPTAAAAGSGIVILAGGIFLIVGWQVFLTGIVLAVFTFLTAVLMHQYWKEEDPGAKMNEMIHFLKDIALCGAALLIAFYADQEWPMSVGG